MAVPATTLVIAATGPVVVIILSHLHLVSLSIFGAIKRYGSNLHIPQPLLPGDVRSLAANEVADLALRWSLLPFNAYPNTGPQSKLQGSSHQGASSARPFPPCPEHDPWMPPDFPNIPPRHLMM